MAHYLITGGCGFIGSHLVERLWAAGHRAADPRRSVDRPPGQCPSGTWTLVVADMREPGAIERALDGIDGVFHLAAIASVVRCNEAWLDSHRVNLGATVALFDACRRPRRRLPVVYASSAAVYGDQAELASCTRS